MSRPGAGGGPEREFVRRTYGIGPAAMNAALIAPIVVMAVCAVLLELPGTQRFGQWLIAEDHLVEWLTFAAAILAGFRALGVARRVSRRVRSRWPALFYAVTGIGLLVYGMEEISWGQRVFHFRTPAALDAANMQGEFNIHNIEWIQSLEKFVFMGVCIAGLLTLRTRRRSDPWAMRPAPFLAGSLLVVLVGMGLTYASFYVSMGRRIEDLLDGLVEVSELLIVVATLAYVHVNGRLLDRGALPADGAEAAATRGPGNGGD
jgi:hypothetical protein